MVVNDTQDQCGAQLSMSCQSAEQHFGHSKVRTTTSLMFARTTSQLYLGIKLLAGGEA